MLKVGMICQSAGGAFTGLWILQIGPTSATYAKCSVSTPRGSNIFFTGSELRPNWAHLAPLKLAYLITVDLPVQNGDFP